MGWLSRLFGRDEEKKVQQAPRRTSVSVQERPVQQTAQAPQAQQIPPERIGLDGQYDQSGLAKSVALAFDQDPQVTDIETLWVAQTGTTVVLKGKAPKQDLERLVSIARGVHGAQQVDISQVQTT